MYNFLQVELRSAQVGRRVLVRRYTPSVKAYTTHFETEWSFVQLNTAYQRSFAAEDPSMQVCVVTTIHVTFITKNTNE